MAFENTQRFVLYTNKYSVRSIMTRFAIALRGTVGLGSIPIRVEEREVDIVEKMEHMDERFLLEVNLKGQVQCLPFDP
jgi:hypothetical protein